MLGMGPTTLHQQALYLDHEKAQLLDELSAETRITKAPRANVERDTCLGLIRVHR